MLFWKPWWNRQVPGGMRDASKKLVTAAEKLMPVSNLFSNLQCHKKDTEEDWVNCTCGRCVSESCVDYDSVVDASGTALQMVAGRKLLREIIDSHVSVRVSRKTSMDHSGSLCIDKGKELAP